MIEPQGTLLGFTEMNKNLKQIWGNKLVASTQPTEWFAYNIWHISQGWNNLPFA
jgi:hypothetical protein